MALRSKCDRAIVALLIKVGAAKNVYPANRSGDKEFPSVTVKCHSFRPDPALVGNYDGQVDIDIQYQAANQPDSHEANRVKLDELVDAVNAALMQGAEEFNDLKATATAISEAGRNLGKLVEDGGTAATQQAADNNKDMADFTCRFWVDGGPTGGQPNEGANAWVERLTFTISACEWNVD